MDVSNKILSDITTFMKYAKHIDNKKRREKWKEIVDRNSNMHKKKYTMLLKQLPATGRLTLADIGSLITKIRRLKW